MKINVVVTDIKWDLEDGDITDLPDEITYVFERKMFNCSEDDLESEIEDIVSNKLTDDYGWCHDGFNMYVEKK